MERFLTFLDNTGHKGIEMANALLTFLTSIDLDISNCRGQSYDNASNMSGKYIGMQTIIRQESKCGICAMQWSLLESCRTSSGRLL